MGLRQDRLASSSPGHGTSGKLSASEAESGLNRELG